MRMSEKFEVEQAIDEVCQELVDWSFYDFFNDYYSFGDPPCFLKYLLRSRCMVKYRNQQCHFESIIFKWHLCAVIGDWLNLVKETQIDDVDRRHVVTTSA